LVEEEIGHSWLCRVQEKRFYEMKTGTYLVCAWHSMQSIQMLNPKTSATCTADRQAS
jgi:hypothetical protein